MAQVNLSADQQRLFQEAEQIQQMMAMPGWAKVEELLNLYEKTAVDDLISYIGTDPNIIRFRQLLAMAIRNTHRKLNADLSNTIAEALELRRSLAKEEYLTGAYAHE